MKIQAVWFGREDHFAYSAFFMQSELPPGRYYVRLIVARSWHALHDAASARGQATLKRGRELTLSGWSGTYTSGCPVAMTRATA